MDIVHVTEKEWRVLSRRYRPYEDGSIRVEDVRIVRCEYYSNCVQRFVDGLYKEGLYNDLSYQDVKSRVSDYVDLLGYKDMAAILMEKPELLEGTVYDFDAEVMSALEVLRAVVKDDMLMRVVMYEDRVSER